MRYCRAPSAFMCRSWCRPHRGSVNASSTSPHDASGPRRSTRSDQRRTLSRPRKPGRRARIEAVLRGSGEWRQVPGACSGTHLMRWRPSAVRPGSAIRAAMLPPHGDRTVADLSSRGARGSTLRNSQRGATLIALAGIGFGVLNPKAAKRPSGSNTKQQQRNRRSNEHHGDHQHITH